MQKKSIDFLFISERESFFDEVKYIKKITITRFLELFLWHHIPISAIIIKFATNKFLKK